MQTKCSLLIKIHMGYWPSLFSQDGWILAKLFLLVYGVSVNMQKKNDFICEECSLSFCA